MPIALRVIEALALRQRHLVHEFDEGDTLRDVLNRDLRAVEAAAGTDMLTSILLVEGSRLRHAAAPSLPASYCEAIDGAEIGPRAGSCGTAAFLGCPIYVKDIASDDLWVDYRSLARQHGLRACWSTPFFDPHGAVIGTFAIYHLVPRSPTPDELAAIASITNHVAWAVMRSKTADGLRRVLGPVPADGFDAEETMTAHGDGVVSGLEVGTMQMIGDNFEALVEAIDRGIAALMRNDAECPDIIRLRRARAAAKMGVALARGGFSGGSIH
jgi:hypothetical protein